MKNSLFAIVLSLFLLGCGDDDLYQTTTTFTEGVLGVLVTDENDVEIEGALISIFDDNNVFVTSAFTDSIGERSFELQQGSYTINVAAQGYFPSPSSGEVLIPEQINNGAATNTIVKIDTNPNAATTTSIQGSVGIRGNLVVLDDGTNFYSTFSDSNGTYYLYNIPGAASGSPATSYTLSSYHAGYESDTRNVAAMAQVPLVDQNLTVTASSALPELTGSVTFLATQNGNVDITVLYPETNQVIPGAVVYTGGAYTLNNLPKGQFKVWASYNNDTYVVDPDWLIKNGGEDAALSINVDSTNLTLDFSVTGAVGLISPTNSLEKVEPRIVTTATPTFEWEAYSSTNEYAVEVKDEDGLIIWGGVSLISQVDGTVSVNHTPIGKNTTAAYNFDASATLPQLEDGKIYIWSVIAIDTGSSTISQSENQVGIIKVELP